jgi:hypothetical protein
MRGKNQVAMMLYKAGLRLASEKRALIMQDPSCRLLSVAEYCRLLISRSELERSDEKSLELAGVRDRKTGRRYFVELEKLGVDR